MKYIFLDNFVNSEGLSKGKQQLFSLASGDNAASFFSQI